MYCAKSGSPPIVGTISNSFFVILMAAAFTSVLIASLSADILTSFSLILDSCISKFFVKI